MANVAHASHHYTSTGLDSKKIAIWTFIGSECMLFASLISTYLIYKGKSVVGPWPHEWWCAQGNRVAATAAELANCPAGQLYKPILNIPITSISTFVLLCSSLAMVLALAAVENKNRPLSPSAGAWEKALRSSKLWLWMTCIMGATFLGFQAYEFTSFVHEGLSIRKNLFGSSFFTLTSFHGMHVFVGLLWALRNLVKSQRGDFAGGRELGVEIFGLYWHFVDIVWIVLFTVIYLL